MDTRWWNLSLGVAAIAVAACGPQVVLEDDSGQTTDGSDTGDTDTTPSGPGTDPTPGTTTPPPPQCLSPDDCAPGQTCRDGACVPNDDPCYYGDGYGGDYGGCCEGDCCYDYGGGDCYYYECYSDEDCGDGALCNTSYGSGYCEGVEQIGPCPQLPELAPLMLPGLDGDDIVSLSFVDADGDAAADLVIGRATGTQLLRGPGGAGPVALPLSGDAVVLDAVSADFNGDGVPDLAAADTLGRVSILAGDGGGGFVLASESPSNGDMQSVAALDFEGDGDVDLAGLNVSGEVLVLLGDGAGNLAGSAALEIDRSASSLAAGEIDGNPATGDLVVQDLFSAKVFFGETNAGLELDGIGLHGQRSLLAADFDGGGISDVVGHTAVSGWTLIETWRDAFGPRIRYGLLEPLGEAVSGLGDVDGDGVVDLALATDGAISLLFGSPAQGGDPMFACASTILTAYDPASIAVGDLDGDGRVEIALDDGPSVVVLSSL